GDGEPDVRNLIGPFGALLADILLFLFGRPAFLLPVVLLVAAWLVFRNRVEALRPVSRVNLAVRVGGFFLLLAASCALATLHWDDGALRATAGGERGQVIGTSLAAVLLPPRPPPSLPSALALRVERVRTGHPDIV